MYTLPETEISRIHYNERDVEVPTLLGTVQRRKGQISSLLDVGARYSAPHYARSLRETLEWRRYTALDLEPDAEVAEIADTYIVCDFLDPRFDIQHSYVTCVSVIEHVGAGTEEYKKKQEAFLSRLLSLAKVGAYLSFPYGAIAVHDTYVNVTSSTLAAWDLIGSNLGFGLSTQFWFNPQPQGGKRWRPIGPSEASNVAALPEFGCRCVCLAEFAR